MVKKEAARKQYDILLVIVLVLFVGYGIFNQQPTVTGRGTSSSGSLAIIAPHEGETFVEDTDMPFFLLFAGDTSAVRSVTFTRTEIATGVQAIFKIDKEGLYEEPIEGGRGIEALGHSAHQQRMYVPGRPGFETVYFGKGEYELQARLVSSLEAYDASPIRFRIA